MRLPRDGISSSPSATVPALMSMSSFMYEAIGVLEATLITGAVGKPKQLPRPVVNRQTLQPPATMPATEGGS